MAKWEYLSVDWYGVTNLINVSQAGKLDAQYLKREFPNAKITVVTKSDALVIEKLGKERGAKIHLSLPIFFDYLGSNEWELVNFTGDLRSGMALFKRALPPQHRGDAG